LVQVAVLKPLFDAEIKKHGDFEVTSSHRTSSARNREARGSGRDLND
jgi:hypothetical protein